MKLETWPFWARFLLCFLAFTGSIATLLFLVWLVLQCSARQGITICVALTAVYVGWMSWDFAKMMGK